MRRFKAYVDNPPNENSEPAWEERYYSFTYGPATFIAIDGTASYLDLDLCPDWREGSEQYEWMINELEKAKENSVFTFIITHPSPFSRGPHGNPENFQTGYNLRVLDPVFREYGVDAVLGSHDHMVEHSLTGPPGYETEMDVTNPENLNYFVMGNSGVYTREVEEGWETWMDILDNDGPPYYTVYFYDWQDTDFSSYLDVFIQKVSEHKWECTFKFVRNDGEVFNEFTIQREAKF